MATVATRVTVGTAAVQVALDRDRGSLLLRNRGSAAVFVGGSGVTSAAGFQVDAGETLALDLEADEAVFAVAASGSHEVHVLRTGA